MDKIIFKRLIACIIDILIVYVLPFSIYIVYTKAVPSSWPTVIFFLSYLLLCLFRDCFWNKKSIGKRIMGLRIINEAANEPARFAALILRNLPVLFIPQIELILICVKNKRIGDFLAGTAVVFDR